MSYAGPAGVSFGGGCSAVIVGSIRAGEGATSPAHSISCSQRGIPESAGSTGTAVSGMTLLYPESFRRMVARIRRPTNVSRSTSPVGIGTPPLSRREDRPSLLREPKLTVHKIAEFRAAPPGMVKNPEHEFDPHCFLPRVVEIIDLDLPNPNQLHEVAARIDSGCSVGVR